jgi:Na+-driven multidrug efflux pump
VIAYYVVGSIAFVAYLRTGGSVVRLSFVGVRFRWPLFRDILRVGGVAALITVQTNLTIAIATGFVGRFGPAAIAGYGTGSRLEYLLIRLVFGLGGPLVAMVGTNIGAGQRDRALRAAWIGAGIAAGGGWLVLRWSADVSYIFVALGAALAAFGLMTAGAIATGALQPGLESIWAEDSPPTASRAPYVWRKHSQRTTLFLTFRARPRSNSR